MGLRVVWFLRWFHSNCRRDVTHGKEHSPFYRYKQQSALEKGECIYVILFGGGKFLNILKIADKIYKQSLFGQFIYNKDSNIDCDILEGF